MKTTISILLIFITFNVFSQNKEVKVSKFDTIHNNITVDGYTYKALQFKHHKKDKYNYGKLGYMKKVIRIKPLGSEFFTNNYELQYWVSENGKVRVFKLNLPLEARFKQDIVTKQKNSVQLANK